MIRTILSQPLFVMTRTAPLRGPQCHHGIDFKNPFTMSKRGRTPNPPRRNAAKRFSVILEFHDPHAHGSENGGAYRDRTDDLKLAKLALSQLS